MPLAQVVEGVVELVTYDPAMSMQADRAEHICREEWDRRTAELARPGPRSPSDDVRVGAAFERLRRDGYIAEMNIGVDQSDAISELRDRLDKTPGARGYVFFHVQDAERLAEEPGDLYIGFGSRPGDDAGGLEAGRAAASAFAAEDLPVTWNGAVATRILLPGLVWRRPLPG